MPMSKLDVRGTMILNTYPTVSTPVAFSYSGNESVANLVSGETVRFNRAIVSSPYYNSSSYVFTAPLKGIYMFSFNIRCNDNNNSYWTRGGIVLNGSMQAHTMPIHNNVTNHYATSSGSWIFQLDVNATVYVRIEHSAGGTAQAFTLTESSFNGALLYQIP